MSDIDLEGEDCPHCGGEGWIDDQCECEAISDGCYCAVPSGVPCQHCPAGKALS